MFERLLFPALAGLLLTPAPAAPPGTIEVPLHFQKRLSAGTPGKRVFIPSGIRYLDKLLQPPPGKWKLPRFSAETPVFSPISLAGRSYLMVLDKKTPESPFFDRLYLDADADGDLTDDPPIDALPSQRRGSYYFANFPPIELNLRLPGGKAPYTFTVRAYMRPTFSTKGKISSKKQRVKGMSLYMTPSCAYAGSFRLNGKDFRILLADTNADGRFGSGEEVTIGFGRKRRDLVYLSRTAAITYQDGLEAQGVLGLGSRLFRVRFRQTEAKLTLVPLENATGKLDLSMDVKRLVLSSGEKGLGIMWFDPPRVLPLPPGSYRLVSYQAARKDDGGNEWVLRASFTPGKAPLATVTAGGKALLRFGEPFTPKVAVYARFPKKAKKGAVTARLSFTLTGIAGEKVTDLRSTTYKKSSVPRSASRKYRPKEPSYEVLDLPSLAVAARGSFHYG